MSQRVATQLRRRSMPTPTVADRKTPSTDPVSLSAEMLLLRVAHQDRAAFVELNTRFANRVFSAAYRWLRDVDTSHEVAQDVWLELWRRAEVFDPARGAASAWLTVLARSRAIDRFRADVAHRERNHRHALTAAAIPDAPFEESVISRLDRGAVTAALAVLSPTQRQMIHLAFFDGLTYPQIAQQCGVPLATVKSRIRDSLIKLRAQLAALHHQSEPKTQPAPAPPVYARSRRAA